MTTKDIVVFEPTKFFAYDYHIYLVVDTMEMRIHKPET